jgi:FtsH-binding integral membrane protein
MAMILETLYKNLHLIGVFMILVALGGLILQQITAVTREQVWRKPVAITHGIGMVLVLVAGFGMLARAGIFWPWPGWVIGKIIIWLVLGVLVAVIGRSPALAKPLWWITIALAAIAAYLALNKPF